MTSINMLPPRIGRVALTVADVDRSIRFYEEVIGLTLLERIGEMARMGAGNKAFLLLQGLDGARPARRVAGLYHFAILVPSRLDLARTLYHLLQVDAPISGYADHNVSEAIYLTDPDGHGIEIYRDRPRAEWQYRGDRLVMGTDPLDLRGILGELDGVPATHRMAAGTLIGHIHLQVARIPDTVAFTMTRLALDLVCAMDRRRLFCRPTVTTHVAKANTWAGENLPLAPDDAARLLWFEIVQPGGAALEAVAERLRAAGNPIERGDDGLWVVDPSGIRILLTIGE
ncbi:MAG: VOC family protein [Candidatus Promineofilum sp.]|uniref:VOC family protein n=1 Tax=Promineifilum sp. TaxID=2664178 RepID=UPI002411E513|nr:VOC family protein [Promineifilum sp.]